MHSSVRPTSGRHPIGLLITIVCSCVFVAGCEKKPTAAPTGPTSGVQATPGAPGAGTGGPIVPDPNAKPPYEKLSEEVRALDPYRLRNHGKLLADRDDEEGYLLAAPVLALVVERNPDDFLDRINLVRVLLFAKGLETYSGPHLEKARELLSGDDGRAALEFLSGLHSKRILDREAAVRHFTETTRVLPELLQGWHQRGYAEEQVENFVSAEDSYREALRIAPKFRPSAYRIGTVLRNLRRRDDARDALAYVQTLPEQHPDTEKCVLTRVERRPYDRAAAQPPPAKLAWTVITETLLTDPAATTGVTDALPFDADDDGAADLFLVGPGAPRLLRFVGGKGRVGSIEVESAADATGAAIADLDNDGSAEIVVTTTNGWMVLAPGAVGSYAEMHPLVRTPRLQQILLFDADHDGDLDLIELADGTAALSRANGDGLFLKMNPFTDYVGGITTKDGIIAAGDAHDLDQRNDIDFVFPASPRTGGSDVTVFLNNRDGTFGRVELPQLGRRTRVLVEDLNNDGAPDFFGYGGEPGWVTAFNADRHGVERMIRLEEPVAVTAPKCGGVHDAVLADIDNDTDLDVLLATDAGMTVLRNSLGALTEESSVALPNGEAGRRIAAVDLDGDCILEAVVCTAAGKLVVLASGLDPRLLGWTIRPVGGRDNAGAVGTVVEQFSGRLYQSVMLKGPAGLHLGAGAATRNAVDGVRLRWPQGIIQPIAREDLEVEPRCDVRFKQKEGLIASCPFLYARGEDGWRFLTDVVGIAPLDEWLPPGREPALDPEEFVRIEGDALASRDGFLELCITEELRETTYLDRVELIAVDHPAATELYLDESTRQGAYDDLEVLAVAADDLAPPARVTVERHASDENRAATVAACDRDYLHPYEDALPQWSGWVERHEVSLVPPFAAEALLLTGRIAWYDSAVSYALHQHGREWGPMTLTRRSDGATLVGDFGLPAGMDRTLVARFSSVPASTPLVLSGHHRFLWDRMLFARNVEKLSLEGAAAPKLRGRELGVTAVDVAAAELEYHGYSAMRGDRGLHEQTYDFATPAPAEYFDYFGRARGHATRYGDVTSLLGEHDDLLAVLVAGDRVRMRFPEPPAPAGGMKRTYFLRISGWAKEGSYHNRTGESIAPLPFRDMSRYPPPAGEGRKDDAYKEYLREFQTRLVQW